MRHAAGWVLASRRFLLGSRKGKLTIAHDEPLSSGSGSGGVWCEICGARAGGDVESGASGSAERAASVPQISAKGSMRLVRSTWATISEMPDSGIMRKRALMRTATVGFMRAAHLGLRQGHPNIVRFWGLWADPTTAEQSKAAA